MRRLEAHTEYFVGAPSPVVLCCKQLSPYVMSVPIPILVFIGVSKWRGCGHTSARHTAGTKMILPREKVWVAPHPQPTARKVSSPMVWVYSHPHRRHEKFCLWSMGVSTPTTYGQVKCNFVVYLLFYLPTKTRHFYRIHVMRWQSHEVSWRWYERSASCERIHESIQWFSAKVFVDIVSLSDFPFSILSRVV